MPEPLRDDPAAWPVSSSTYLHRGDWVLALRADDISAPGRPEQEFRRFVVEMPGAVVVLAVDEHDRAVVLRQYRHAARARLVELPAGLLDVPGEDPLVAAQRELREETGLEAAEWRHLLTVLPSPGHSEETQAIYVARDLTQVDRGFEPEHEEAEMSVDRVPVAELVDAVLDGRLRDSPLAVAVLAHDALSRRSGPPTSE